MGIYTGETAISPDGIECAVIDTSRVNFDLAALGRKSAETLVKEAKGGERIETKAPDGRIESVYVAKSGDAIFVNLHNPADVYVPGSPDGTRWQASQIARNGYVTVRLDDSLGGVIVKNGTSFRLRLGAVDRPSCIRDAWGPDQHQFLAAGAVLKRNGDGSVTGIDRAAFDATWEIVAERVAPPRPGGVAKPGEAATPRDYLGEVLPAFRSAFRAVMTPDLRTAMGIRSDVEFTGQFAFEKLLPRVSMLPIGMQKELFERIDSIMDAGPDAASAPRRPEM